MDPVAPFERCGLTPTEVIEVDAVAGDFVTVPALANDADGVVTTEWEPTSDDLERLYMGGRVRVKQHTFGDPMQPMSVEVVLPELTAKES